MFFRTRNDRISLSGTALTLLLLAVSLVTAAAQSSPAAEPATGVEGIITISPAHGGPSRPGIPDSKPLMNTTFVVENEKGAVASFATDNQGQFRISLTPGHYAVSMKDKKPKIGRYGPFEVDVVAGQMTKVAWTCDTGMR